VPEPSLPTGPHRGRISIAPGALAPLADDLRDLRGVRWCAELGVGTVHVAADTVDALVAARAAAGAHGGWMLREAGGDGVDGFGRSIPNRAVMQRIKHAFDPTGKLAPGRLPL
jgi:FAD/FMN-containing dehydrogenase